MYRKLLFLVSLVLVLAFVSNASAVVTTWTNSDPCDSLWDTAGNWNTLAVPTNVDEVHLSTPAIGPLIDSSTTAFCTNMRGPGHSGATSMDIIGGSLTTNGYWSIGQNPGSNGTANVRDNATVTVNGGDLYVGNHGSGTLNVGAMGAGDNTYIYTSAFLRISNQIVASNFGHVNLYSGTITCNDIFGIAGQMLTDIYEGTLIIRAKTGAPIQNWITNGYIIAYGGTGDVILTVDENGWDVLTAKIDTVVVDDFDSYADSADLKNTWVENKAGVVHLEETIAHDGNSMKIVYDGASPYYYEAVRTYGTAQDWTVYDIKALDVWFRGKSTNDVEQMYVTLSDGTNSATVVNDDPDPNAVKSEVWKAWRIDLQDFTDVNMAGVEEISIGLGDGISPAGSGEVYFDDVALFPSRCLDKPTISEGNLNNDCVIDLRDFATIADNWLKSGMWP